MKKIWPFAIGLLLVGCTESAKTNEELALETMQAAPVQERKISEETITRILNSIPSPLEISSIIKESGGSYQKSFLNSSGNGSSYNTTFKKAVNLGIYSTDLGYINIYEQNTDALVYLSSVKDLAEGLNIGHFFDMVQIKRLATNSNNIDSLLRITTSNFEKINQFLQDNKRSEQSVLILTGGWIEALHISCQVAKVNNNPKLLEKIGEQKIIIDQLMLLLANYPNDSNVQQLAGELKKLQEIFNTIEITYIYKEPTMKEVDGMLVIVDESESKVNITTEHLESITRITEDIRKSLIS